jgi:hypothetical protein
LLLTEISPCLTNDGLTRHPENRQVQILLSAIVLENLSIHRRDIELGGSGRSVVAREAVCELPYIRGLGNHGVQPKDQSRANGPCNRLHDNADDITSTSHDPVGRRFKENEWATADADTLLGNA